jgi:pyruvate dehydrogenase E1 component alpha subunit
MGTSVERHSASTDLAMRGQAYGIPGESVDGMDVLAVQEAADRVVPRVRAGEGPYILEVKTYRYRGHSMSDPAKYRSKEEVSRMRSEHDPIDQVKAKLLETGVVDDAWLKDVDKEIKAVVIESAEFSQSSPEPDASELFTDILIDA